jgi:hypothetical protein
VRATEAGYYEQPAVLGWGLCCHACHERVLIPVYPGDRYQLATDPITTFVRSHLDPHLAYADVVLNGRLARVPVVEREV